MLTALYFYMEQNLWAGAFVLALLKTTLDLFHDEMDRDGTLGSQEGATFYIISKVYHGTPSSHVGLRKFLSSQHHKNSTSTDNKMMERHLFY